MSKRKHNKINNPKGNVVKITSKELSDLTDPTKKGNIVTIEETIDNEIEKEIKNSKNQSKPKEKTENFILIFRHNENGIKKEYWTESTQSKANKIKMENYTLITCMTTTEVPVSTPYLVI